MRGRWFARVEHEHGGVDVAGEGVRERRLGVGALAGRAEFAQRERERAGYDARRSIGDDLSGIRRSGWNAGALSVRVGRWAGGGWRRRGTRLRVGRLRALPGVEIFVARRGRNVVHSDEREEEFGATGARERGRGVDGAFDGARVRGERERARNFKTLAAARGQSGGAIWRRSGWSSRGDTRYLRKRRRYSDRRRRRARLGVVHQRRWRIVRSARGVKRWRTSRGRRSKRRQYLARSDMHGRCRPTSPHMGRQISRRNVRVSEHEDGSGGIASVRLVRRLVHGVCAVCHRAVGVTRGG